MLLFEPEQLPAPLILPEGKIIWQNKREIDYSKVHYYAKVGAKDMFWYQDCERIFADMFGVENLGLIASMFAATSINTSLKSNITLFRKAYYQHIYNLPIEGYLPNIKTQLERIREGLELSGRKILSFKNAMSGDKEAIVVDIHILRAFDQDRRYYRANDNRERSAGATEKQYDIIEAYMREEAHKLGIEPRQFCSMVWAGTRISNGGDRETHYKNILKHQFTNLFNVI